MGLPSEALAKDGGPPMRACRALAIGAGLSAVARLTHLPLRAPTNASIHGRGEFYLNGKGLKPERFLEKTKHNYL